MASNGSPFKRIVASLVIGVGISIPAAHAQTETLDEMFESLKQADPEEAARIEERIADRWARSGSPTIDLLFQRGRQSLEEGDAVAAVEHFTATIDHAPDFVEAYHGRATAFFVLEKYGPAIDDLREVLVHNPRHFGALRGFAIILEQLDEEQAALEVLRRVRSIHPHMAEVPEAIERLELKLDGTPL